MTLAQVESVYVEALSTGVPLAQVESVYVEALSTGAPLAQVEAVYIEALVPNASAVAITVPSGAVTATATAPAVRVGTAILTAAPDLLLEADAITGLSDGASVSTWSDGSGNGNHATAGSAPTYKTGQAPSGLAVVRFNGTSNYLNSAASTSGASQTVVAVVKVSGSTNRGIRGGNDGGKSVFVGSPAHVEIDKAGVDQLGISSTYPVGWHLIVTTLTSSATVVRVDGTTVASAAGATLTSGQTTAVGRYSSGGYYWDSDMALLASWSRVLSGSEIDAIEAEAAAKWGVLVKGQISATSDSGAGWGAANLFDGRGSTVTLGCAWASAGTPSYPQNLTVTFPAARTVATYVMTARDSDGAEAPKAWTFYGSPDGSTWTSLDSRSGITFADAEVKSFAVSSPASYPIYKLAITTGPPSPATVSFAELEFTYAGTASPASVTVPSASITITATAPVFSNPSGYVTAVLADSPLAYYHLNETIASAVSLSTLSTARTSGSGFAAAIIAAAPLGYWRLGEASTASAMADSSGNGRSGSYSGSGTTSATGLVHSDSDTAMSFNGSGCGLVSFAPWMVTNSFAVHATITPSSVTGIQTIASRYDPTSGNLNPSSFWFRLNGNNLECHIFVGNTAGAATGTTVLTTGTTYDVAATYDGTTVKVYINGTLEASATRAGMNEGTVGFSIGSRIDAVGEPFHGVIDDVAYFEDAVLGSTPIIDSSGNSHTGSSHATMASATGLLSGSGDAALNFSTGHVRVPGGSWQTTSNISFDGLIQISSSTGHNFLASKGAANVSDGFQFRLNAGKLEFITIDFGGRATGTLGASSIANGVTHHIAATYDSSTKTTRLYVDGVQDGITSGATYGLNLTSTTLPTIIGAYIDGSLSFAGVMDEFAMYGTTLSSTRIAAHYTAATTSSASPATITVPAGTVTATATAPVVSVGTGATLAVPSGSVAITATAPVVSVGTGASISTSVGALTVDAAAPVVSAGSAAAIAIPTGSVTADAAPPAVSAGTGMTVVVPAGTATLDSTAPVVDVGVGVSVTVSAGLVVLDAAAPGVSVGVGILIAVQVGLVALDGGAPLVSVGVGLTVAVSAGSLVLNMSAPRITIFTPVLPPVERLVLVRSEKRVLAVQAEQRVLSV